MMAFELILLGVLIVIFILSFCGLLQKVRRTYERERTLADEIARRRADRSTQRNSGDSFEQIYDNPSFGSEGNNELGVFPAAPPPYMSLNSTDPPPKYEDIIKDTAIVDITIRESTTPQPPLTQRSSSPPPYTITV